MRLQTEFKIPLLLHPINARHKQALSSGYHLRTPQVTVSSANSV